MALLFTQEIQDELIKEISNVKHEIKIISAFCKTDALAEIDAYLNNNVKEKRLLVRFKLSDIIAGAVDISLFDYCKTHGWEMYINFDLHIKTYIFDNIRGIVGSCNLTSRGLGFSSNYNYEIATLTKIDDEDMLKINNLFSKSVKMNEDLFNKMKAEYDKLDLEAGKSYQWSNELLSLCHPDLSVLFTHYFPSATFSHELTENDYSFMEYTGDLSLDDLKKCFKESIAFLWLKDQLIHVDDETLFFGALTQSLHSSLINDPKPYRKEVKELLANLLDWVQKLQIDEIVIDTPNHSQRVKINTQNVLI